ncbi:hypothetical protein CLU79DRAFT_829947 [Phycomyces nitens]|nr:hypothetical protein CLU79DRAFT_829947 [Phycomyces nitens]
MISLQTTRIALLTLAEKSNALQRNVILSIEAILPAIKDLDINDVNESELTSSFIHPFIQGLFAVDHEDRVARCANVVIAYDDQGKRPDYVVDVYKGYTRQFRSCIGEIKSARATATSQIEDFYRLAIFAAELMNNGTNSVLAFQAIGKTTIDGT